MKKLLAAALFISAVVVAAPARAASSGVTLALRSGFGLPLGNVAGSSGAVPAAALSDQISLVIPIWVDAGYRFNKNIFAGAYFQYGFAPVNKDKAFGGGICTITGVSCSAHNLRFGIEGMYKFMPDASFAPWVGLGIGYETATVNVSAGNASVDATTSGIEFLNLQLGGDFAVSPIFGIGPYVALSIASYSSASVAGTDVPNYPSGTHEWLQFGVKGTFNL